MLKKLLWVVAIALILGFVWFARTGRVGEVLGEKVQAGLKKDAASKKAEAEALLGMKLPDWGYVEGVTDAQGFDLVSFQKLPAFHIILLFTLEQGNALSLVQMLERLDGRMDSALDERAPKKLASVLKQAKFRPRWTRLTPTVVGKEQLSLRTGQVEAKRVHLRDGSKGTMVEVEKNGRAMIVFSYATQGVPTAVLEDFLNELLAPTG